MEQRFLSEEESEDEAKQQQDARQSDAARRSLQHPVTGVRQEAAPLVGNQLEPEVVETLMRQLEKAEGSRTNPKWMEPAEREALLAQLISQAKTRKRLRRQSSVLYGIGYALYMSLTLGYILGLLHVNPLITLLLLIFYSLMAAHVRRSEKQWVMAAKRLAKFDDLRAAGPLMEALDLKQPEMVVIAEQALMDLLPRFQASDADGITAAQRECLYRGLKVRSGKQSNAEFVTAALKALEQIGDEKALPYVEALTANDGTGHNTVQIRDAAQRCLTFLKMRMEQQQYSASLLRASSNADAASDHLLRPAAGSVPVEDPQQLLRSSNEE